MTTRQLDVPLAACVVVSGGCVVGAVTAETGAGLSAFLTVGLAASLTGLWVAWRQAGG